jgi:hypothetical protein
MAMARGDPRCIGDPSGTVNTRMVHQWSTRTVLIGGYVLIAIALLTCQWAASRSAARVARIGDIVSATKRRRAGWVALVLAWWWLGFHVLARSSALDS